MASSNETFSRSKRGREQEEGHDDDDGEEEEEDDGKEENDEEEEEIEIDENCLNIESFFETPATVSSLLRRNHAGRVVKRVSGDLTMEDFSQLCHFWSCHFTQFHTWITLLGSEEEQEGKQLALLQRFVGCLASNLRRASREWSESKALLEPLKAIETKYIYHTTEIESASGKISHRILPSSEPFAGVDPQNLLPTFRSAALKMITQLQLKSTVLSFNPDLCLGETHYDRVAKILRGKESILVLTGAGISVAAGIPDFRSPHSGLYSILREKGLLKPEDPETKVFDIGEYLKDQRLALEAFTAGKLIQTDYPQPTAAHKFIAFLEEKGKLLRCYTQNIDGLDSKAGTTKLVEVHGNLKKARCNCCGEEFGMDEFKKELRLSTASAPRCKICNRKRGAIVRPNMVFFGESTTLEKGVNYERDIEDADCLLIIGTSLQVEPFNRAPKMFDQRRRLKRSKGKCLPMIVMNLNRSDLDSSEVAERFEFGEKEDTGVDLILEGDCQVWARFLQRAIEGIV